MPKKYLYMERQDSAPGKKGGPCLFVAVIVEKQG
jgi:hypothetical protein